MDTRWCISTRHLKIHIKPKIVIPGIRDVKALVTAGGTPSGIEKNNFFDNKKLL